ncbi:hypothetical protein KAW18_12190 [candidate division WOR-3 bacterium]|nr:hypothetical protein [candidate division WOR-3 bacterium]
MRFSKDENTYILAEFTSGDAVTIDIYRLSDDVKVIDNVNVSEVSLTGTFKYLFNVAVTEKTEFLLIMSNGIIDKRGKIVLGGYPDDIEDLLGAMETDLTFIKEIEGGRWKIDTSTKQMIFYNEAGTVEVAKFQLYDKDHNSAYADVMERERI